MPYIRCDENCDPVPNQPKHTTVKQKISCIEYEIYNTEYQRSNLIGGGKMPNNTPSESGKLLKQPDIFDGWNGDYEQTQADGTVKKGIAIFQVQQNLEDSEDWYIKYDVNNEPAEIKCYERVDFFGCYPCPVNDGEPALDDPTCPCGKPDSSITFEINGEVAYLAVQDDRDNIFVTENHVYHIALETNTVIDGIVSDAQDNTFDYEWIIDESGNRYIETNGMMTRIE